MFTAARRFFFLLCCILTGKAIIQSGTHLEISSIHIINSFGTDGNSLVLDFIFQLSILAKITNDLSNRQICKLQCNFLHIVIGRRIDQVDSFSFWIALATTLIQLTNNTGNIHTSEIDLRNNDRLQFLIHLSLAFIGSLLWTAIFDDLVSTRQNGVVPLPFKLIQAFQHLIFSSQFSKRVEFLINFLEFENSFIIIRIKHKNLLKNISCTGILTALIKDLSFS